MSTLQISCFPKINKTKMTPFRILIVEDEILIADNIKRNLTKRGHEVVGIAISYDQAIQLYNQESPDIVLLDIRLNGNKTGIDIAHYIQNQETFVPFIFLTSQIDIKNINSAKETFPAGYLSKPIQKDSLFATLEIAMHKQASFSKKIPTIPIYDGTKNHIVPINNILYIESEHVYVKVFLAHGNYIIKRSSLKELLKQLPKDQFIQTHRSYAINTKKISRWDMENVYIEDLMVPVSRSRRKELFGSLRN